MKKYWSSIIQIVSSQSFVLISLFLVVFYFQNAWVPGFFLDGGTYAAVSKHAAQENLWLVPKLTAGGYADFFEHPPLLFVFGGLFFKIFGVGFLQARLLSGLFFAALVASFWIFLKNSKSRNYLLGASLLLMINPLLFKKVRFLSLDIPLALFGFASVMSYFYAYKKNTVGWWALSGVFMGLAFLVKGHAGYYIPLTMFVHILVTKNFRLFLNWKLYFSWILGTLIFGLWPFFLWQSGRFDGFLFWFNRQFTGTVVESRGKESFDFFFYIFLLCKVALPSVVFSICGIKRIFRESKNSLEWLLLSAIVVILIPLSLMKWKYSHYIIPILPFLALLGAYRFEKIGEKVQVKVFQSIKVLVVLAGCALLVFPLTTNIRRDKEFFKTKQVLSYLKESPEAWGDIDGAYGFWTLAANVGFSTEAEAYNLSYNQVIDYLQSGSLHSTNKWVFTVKKGGWERILREFPEAESKMIPVIYFQKRDLLIVVDRSITYEKRIFIEKD